MGDLQCAAQEGGGVRRPSGRRAGYKVACAALFVVAGYAIATHSADAGPEENGERGAVRVPVIASGAATRAPERSTVTVRDTGASPLVIRVRDAATGAPIVEAAAALGRAAESRTVAHHTMTHTADSAGALHFSARDHGQRVLVWAPGYLAGETALDAPSTDLLLQRGHSFSVAVSSVESGASVEGVSLTVCNALINWSESYVDPSVGTPSSDAPIWVSRTDASGVAHFRGVPAGDYDLRLGGGRHCFTTVDASGSYEHRISVPCGQVAVRVHEAVGIVVCTPSLEPLEHAEFHYDWGATQRSPCNNRQRQMTCVDALESRFPGCRAACTVPMDPHKQLPVEVFAVTRSGAYTLRWAMLPLSQIDTAVVMEPVADAAVGRITVEIGGPSGRMDGIPIMAIAANHRFEVVSGRPTTLLAGHYTLSVPPRAVWLEDHIDGKACYVAPNAESTLSLEVPFDVANIRVDVEAAPDAFDVPIDVYAKGAVFSATRTLMPGEPAVFSMPAGPVEVGAHGYGWVPCGKALDATVGAVQVTLQPQRGPG